MNDFVFFILTDGSIRKVLLTDEAVRDIVALWEPSYTKFISDEITEVALMARISQIKMKCYL